MNYNSFFNYHSEERFLYYTFQEIFLKDVRQEPHHRGI